MRALIYVCIFVQIFTLGVTESGDHHVISFVNQQSKKQIVGNNEKLWNSDNFNTFESSDDLEAKKNAFSNEKKRSIPALEPVRHLLNHAREGGLNHTLPGQTGNKETRHQLFVPNRQTGNESSAIETEEDRESANESTELQFLDTLGRIGSKIFEFFGNLQRLFAASSGSASAGLSTTSSQ